MAYQQIVDLENSGIPEDPIILDDLHVSESDLAECLRWWRHTDERTIRLFGLPKHNDGRDYERDHFTNAPPFGAILAPHFATFFHGLYTHMHIDTPGGSLYIYKIKPGPKQAHNIVTNSPKDPVAFGIITLFTCDIPMLESAVMPAKEPAKEPMKEPADKSMKEPADKSMKEPADKSMKEPADKSMEKPTKVLASVTVPSMQDPMSNFINTISMLHAMNIAMDSDNSDPSAINNGPASSAVASESSSTDPSTSSAASAPPIVTAPSDTAPGADTDRYGCNYPYSNYCTCDPHKDLTD